MNRTKKLSKIIGVLIAFFILCLCIAVTWSYFTEWTLRSKTYNIKYPIQVNNSSISEIEKQVKSFVLDKYENAYLGEITIATDSDEGFDTFSDGTIIFTYCHKLEDSFIYQYDRFVHCEVCVDLKSKQIEQFHIYGNQQLGGLIEIESYPEIDEIRKDLYLYCDSQEMITRPYTVEKSYLRIYHYGIASTSFTIRLSNGSEIELKNILR